jgi:hypothetical protein
MSVFYANYPVSGSASGGSNPSVGANGAPAPAESTEIGFIDNSGNLQGVSPSNPLPVTIDGGLANPLNVNIADYGGTATSLGQKASAASMPVVIASDQSAVPISAASLPLPTGAATSANQVTQETTLSAIQANQTNGTQVVTGSGSFTVVQPSGANLHVDVDNFPATQPVSGTVTANQGTSPWIVSGSGTAGTPAAGVVTVQGNASGTPIPVSLSSSSQPVNSNGSASNSTTIGSGSATSFSPPANAVGFILEADDTNTVNLRWAAGTTATASVGLLMEPGRDTGFVPVAVTVSVIAVSGSAQAVGIQWILSH